MEFPALPQNESIASIGFLADDVDCPAFDEPRLQAWLQRTAAHYGYEIDELTYVFCSDDTLHLMNVEHLNHDTLTDIITFDLSDSESSKVSGECYISLDRVRENAKELSDSYELELYRVIVHGLLHLCGLDDKNAKAKATMRAAEDEALAQLGV